MRRLSSMSGDELTTFVERCLCDTAYASALGGRARELVAGQAGATGRTLAGLALLMPPARQLCEHANRSAA